MSRSILLMLAASLACCIGCDEDKPAPTQADTSPATRQDGPPATPAAAATDGTNDSVPRSEEWRRINALLASGTSPNSTDALGIPLLHNAAMESATDAVELLIERGADPNLADAQIGWTALHWAASLGDVERTRVLLAKGAKPDVTDHRGRTPAHVAAENADPGVLDLLVQHGASLAARDRQGATPLHAAVRAGQPAVVVWLLNHGAPLDARDAAGRTPTDLADLLQREDLRALFDAAQKKRPGG